MSNKEIIIDGLYYLKTLTPSRFLNALKIFALVEDIIKTIAQSAIMKKLNPENLNLFFEHK